MTEDGRPSVHALLVYDLKRHHLVEQRLFDQASHQDPDERAEAATLAYFECEQSYRQRPDIEVVLLAADTLATIQTTHRSYFMGEVPSPANVDPSDLLQKLEEIVKSLDR